VAPEYLAHITSIKNRCTIAGVLQENIMMRVESRWAPFIPTEMLTTVNLLAQGITGGAKSLITRATTRRLWTGSSPMVLSLKLRFEAIDNPFIDVVEPIRLLQSIAIPSEGTGGGAELGDISALSKTIRLLEKLPVLSPPGPTPFTTEGMISAKRPINELSQSEIVEGAKGGDRIILQLGKFVQFDNVILKEATTLHHIKMDPEGNPISGEISLIFETYEMPTVQSLEKAYQKTAMVKYSIDEDKGRREIHSATYE